MKLNTLKNILNNGGATLNKKQKQVNYKKGYQVSKKDCYILNIDNTNEILQAVNDLQKTINKNEFVGLWVENGLVYIDISIKFNILENAIEYGKALKQISIFDWANKTCIYLK